MAGCRDYFEIYRFSNKFWKKNSIQLIQINFSYVRNPRKHDAYPDPACHQGRGHPSGPRNGGYKVLLVRNIDDYSFIIPTTNILSLY